MKDKEKNRCCHGGEAEAARKAEVEPCCRVNESGARDGAEKSCCSHAENTMSDCCAGVDDGGAAETECRCHCDDSDEVRATNHSHGEHCEKSRVSAAENADCCGHAHKADSCRKEKEHGEDCCCSSHKKQEETSCCGHTPHTSECCGSHDEEESCACCNLKADYTVKKEKISKDTVKRIIKLSVSLVFLIMGFFDWHAISGGQGVLMAFYYVNPAWVAVIVCGADTFVSAARIIRKGKVNTSVLISVAMIASIALEITGFFVSTGDGHGHSYVFAAGEIAFLMSLGAFLEDITVSKCRSGIQQLVGLIPTEANVLRDGELERVALDKVSIGDTVVVKAGEMIPVDGAITKGFASVDQSSLTGEYLPVDVQEGDSVFGGTMNTSGVIEVEVTKLKKDMTIAKMAELTIEAEGKKAPISRITDRWSKIIVPTVFVVSLLVGIIAGFGFNVGAVDAVVRAITVLVVFCPCALVLATPTAVAAGLGNAARNGVLVKSGAAIEEMANVKVICFDKTGTITEGNIEMDDMIAADGESAEELNRLAASVERFSEHPLAKAVVKKANCTEYYEAKNISTMQGIGVGAEVNGRNVVIMSRKHALQNGVNVDEFAQSADGALSVGKTLAYIVVDGRAAGLMTFSDTVRENAKEVMQSLADRGYKTVMLTGDNEKSAKYIAEQCGIAEVRHSLMPEDKLAEIEKLQKSGVKVAMIGDGINDAPALKLADCSLAMGAMGSDIAIETADMAILNSDIKKVEETAALSRRVMSTIKRNIFIAMTINIAAVIISAMGYLNPASGALIHNCTSVLVVASSALLLYNAKRRRKQAAAGSAASDGKDGRE